MSKTKYVVCVTNNTHNELQNGKVYSFVREEGANFVIWLKGQEKTVLKGSLKRVLKFVRFSGISIYTAFRSDCLYPVIEDNGRYRIVGSDGQKTWFSKDCFSDEIDQPTTLELLKMSRISNEIRSECEEVFQNLADGDKKIKEKIEETEVKAPSFEKMDFELYEEMQILKAYTISKAIDKGRFIVISNEGIKIYPKTGQEEV